MLCLSIDDTVDPNLVKHYNKSRINLSLIYDKKAELLIHGKGRMLLELLEKTLLGIRPAFYESMSLAKERLDSLVKPLGSLGKLEEAAIKLSGISGSLHNPVEKKCIIVMSSDNGIVEEGVSSSPQSVTASQTINFVKGIAGISILAKQSKADIKVIDIGINADISYPGIIDKKIRKGTWNIAKGPAMSYDEAIKSLETGIEIVGELADEGYSLLGTGEMGIGNTSTSSALAVSLIGCDVEAVVGKGAGLTENDFVKKKEIIRKSISINKPVNSDPLDVLSKVGGFDIGGMAGCFIGAAYYRMPILIDGFISAASALLAYRLNPFVADYMFPSHCSAEPGFMVIMKELGMSPFLNLNMRLGEGTGTALAFNIIEAANAIAENMATFEEASIADSFLIDIR